MLTNCVKCGATLTSGTAFCAQCGWQVTDPGMATVAVATADQATVTQAPPAAGEATLVEAAGAVPVDPFLLQLRKELAADYDVDKELGRGGMAVVYRAVERELHRQVAIKVLPPGMGGGEMAERFRREARLAAQLDHPNIIPIYRVGQVAGTYYFAMKFVEGRAVDAIVESQGALPVPIVLHILRAAAGALAFAHDKGVVHRDIKGANIMVDRDGRVLVADFGIARAAEEKTLTASGSVIGTPHFMSPEQCSGQKVGPQSDQYSLGVLAFQMLTGQVPFDADSLMGVLQHHFFTPVPDITQVRDGVPPELLDIVSRALGKKSEERYATTREMLRALEAVPYDSAELAAAQDQMIELARGTKVATIRTGSLPPLPATGPLAATSAAPTVTARRPSARKKRGPVVLVLGIVVTAAALGGAGYWVWQQQATKAAAADSVATPPSAGALQPATGGAAAPATDSAARLDSAAAAAARDTTRAAPAEPVRTAADRPRRDRPTRTGTPPPSAATPAAQQPAADPALLRVSTSPPNAEIFVNGRSVGVGGVVDEPIPAGRAVRIRIQAAGFRTYETIVTPEPGGAVRLGRITLQPESQP